MCVTLDVFDSGMSCLGSEREAGSYSEFRVSGGNFPNSGGQCGSMLVLDH